MSENPSEDEQPVFGGDDDRILDDEDALDWWIHPDPRYIGELEMQAREYEDQLWEQVLAEDPAPRTKPVPVDAKTFDCTFCSQVQHFTTKNNGEHADNCPTQYMSEEMRDNTHCFRCGGPTQPEGGVRFFSVGEYGSTVFDSDHDREYLLLFICDECLCRGQRKVLHWSRGQKGYREFDPGPQFRPKMPSVTLETTAKGKVRVFNKFGSLSCKGQVEEAQALRTALLDAVKGLDETIEDKSRTVDEVVSKMNERQARLSESLQETIEALKPALEQDNIKAFSLSDVPKIQERVDEILNEEQN